MELKKKFRSLRTLMQKKGLSAYILPNTDPHLSEYKAEHWQIIKWLSGFTGAGGQLVVTQEKVGLWVGGTESLQAEKELQGTPIKIFKKGKHKIPTAVEWLCEQDVTKVGYNSKLFSISTIREMKNKFSEHNKTLESHVLLPLIWKNRPPLPPYPIYLHDVKFTGKSTSEKLGEIREVMHDEQADHYLLTTLDDMAWTFNIRGHDVKCWPVPICYGVISPEKAHLFIKEEKVPNEEKKVLEEVGIEIHPYNSIVTHLKKLGEGESILFDPKKTSKWLFDSIPDQSKTIEKTPAIATKKKAIKNPTEIKNMKKCLIRDGVALLKFFRWLETNVTRGEITELSAAEKLKEFQEEQENFVEPSFPSIVAYKEHAAMMHYVPSSKNNSELKSDGFFLIDSGGQYFDGTTDITRTIPLGNISKKKKREFTLVLKGHIQLALAKFLKGTKGVNLDILARKPIWNAGIDYKCGTGHGVGFFLNVHENPPGINQDLSSDTEFEEQMITTIEPGIYKPGEYGIRIENMFLTVEDTVTDFGEFMRFEPISFCPISIDAIDPKLLTKEEKNWLNNYHERVFEVLSPYLDKSEKKWLKKKTRKI